MRYEAPETLDAAVGLLTSESGLVKVLAGGTDVLVQLHADMVEPDLIVDIKNIAEMREVVNEDGAWRVGAAVTGKELMDHADFNAAWPGVMDGVRLIGSVQVRGRATVGGNLCNASPAADSVPAIIAAGAVASVFGPGGRREVPVEDIVTGPGRISLVDGEIVVSFQLPKRPANSGDAYLRFTPRTEMDIAVVGCGVNITLDDSGTCTDAFANVPRRHVARSKSSKPSPRTATTVLPTWRTGTWSAGGLPSFGMRARRIRRPRPWRPRPLHGQTPARGCAACALAAP